MRICKSLVGEVLLASRKAHAVLVVLTLALGAALASAPAFASQVHCGEVLTHNTTLDNDLLACPGDGLVIGADGITVNLNGHLLEGTGGSNGGNVIYGDTEDGVDNTAGHSGVTIENGEIRGFDTGVKLYEADRNRVQGLNSHGNLAGAILVESVGNRVESSSFRRNSYGVYLVESDGNNVSGNDLGLNVFAFYTVTSSENVVWNNTAIGNALLGFQVTGQSNRNWIKGNRIEQSPYVGMLVTVSYDNRIEDNLLQDHRHAGLLLGNAAGSVVRRNRILRVGYPQGSLDPDGTGITVTLRSDGLVLDRNVVAGYPDGIELSGSSDVTISRNEARGSTRDGIRVLDGSPGAVIERNLATGNADDGLDVKDGTADVSGNVANQNGDYGIEAVPGVDGGGNKASGNGNPAQCLNVRCK